MYTSRPVISEISCAEKVVSFNNILDKYYDYKHKKLTIKHKIMHAKQRFNSPMANLFYYKLKKLTTKQKILMY